MSRPKLSDMPRPQRKYGWRPDLPDHRDKLYLPRQGLLAAQLPERFSQRTNWPAPYDQGQLGSCTGNGVAGVCHYRLVREGKEEVPDVNAPADVPSRLFIYYFERVLEGTVNQDSGAQIRDGIKVVVAKGFPFENVWPYSDDPYTFRKRPGLRVQKLARRELVKSYSRVDNTDLLAIKQAVTEDHPVVFGATLYQSFESQEVAQSGLVPMPSRLEQPIGGHCMVIVGYNDAKQIGGDTGAFEIRNSWGGGWGDSGYCWIPYAYLTNPNLASDFWIVSAI